MDAPEREVPETDGAEMDVSDIEEGGDGGSRRQMSPRRKVCCCSFSTLWKALERFSGYYCLIIFVYRSSDVWVWLIIVCVGGGGRGEGGYGCV